MKWYDIDQCSIVQLLCPFYFNIGLDNASTDIWFKIDPRTSWPLYNGILSED